MEFTRAQLYLLLNSPKPLWLHGADLHEVDLRGAGLTGANLVEARLRGANLFGAILSNARLRGADLRGADLVAARLRGADLREANLQGAVVTDRQLGRAKSLEGATMPDGSIHCDVSPVAK